MHGAGSWCQSFSWVIGGFVRAYALFLHGRLKQSDDVCVHERPAWRARDFGHRKGGRDKHAAWMCERHEAHVVVVKRVGGYAIRKSCLVCTGAFTGSKNPAPAAPVFRSHL